MGKIIKGYFEEDYSLLIEDEGDAGIVKSRIFFHDEEPSLTAEEQEEAPVDPAADAMSQEGAVTGRRIEVIGFAGQKRSGKDTAAQIARRYFEEAGWEVHTIAFADALREYALKLDPWVVSDHDGHPEPLARVISAFGWENCKDTSYAESVREVLQRLGADVMRAVDEDVWVKLAGRKMQEILEGGPHSRFVFIFTDVRFENEVQFILENSGAVFEMRRPGRSSEDSHVSEFLELEPNGTNIFAIDNDGNLEQLKKKLSQVLGWLLDGQADL